MRLAAPLLALLALALAAAPAHAATVELVKVRELPPYVSGGDQPWDPDRPATDVLELRVVGEAGDADDLRLDGLRVTATTPLRAGAQCRADAPGSVVCTPVPLPGHAASVGGSLIDLGDGDDRLSVVAGGGRAFGGDGADVLEVVSGGGGTWDGGPGADRMAAPGWTVDYGTRSAPVTVTLDGVANDGEAGEGDDVGTEARSIGGGAGPDRLVGGAHPLELRGAGGDDLLEAPARPEDAGTRRTHLYGGDGNDRLLGGDAPDSLEGEAGDDELLAGAGADVMAGGPGADRVDGGPGDDSFGLDALGDGAPDVTAGGDGRDTAVFRGDFGRAGNVAIDLADADGPDGPVTERDALAADVEDVEAVGVHRFAVAGTDGPNRLEVRAKVGSIDGRGGDDVLDGSDTYDSDIRVTGGPGADRVRAGTGNRVDLRDGEADALTCENVNLRELRVDPGLDQPPPCIYGIQLDGGRSRVRAGRRASTRVRCIDPYHPCRLLLRPRIGRPRLHLRAVRLTIPAAGSRRVWLRIPARTPPGHRFLDLRPRRANPFPGAPAVSDAGTGLSLRVLPRRR